MPVPPGATHYLPVTMPSGIVVANMPDVGSTFAADLVINQAAAINYEGGAEAFVDGLAAGCTDLRILSADTVTEVPFGVKQFSQVAGSRKLILGLGMPSAYPLLAASNTVLNLYRGCTGGTFEAKSSVVPTADGFVGYWPLEEASGAANDWTANANHLTRYGSIGPVAGQVGTAQQIANATSDRFADTAPFGGAVIGSFSVSAWFKASDVTWPGWCGIVGRYGSVHNYYLITVDGTEGRIRGGFYDTGNADRGVTTGTTVMYDNTWALLILIFDNAANTLTLYVNGVQKAQATGMTQTPKDEGAVTISQAPHIVGHTYDEFILANVPWSTNWLSSYYAITNNNGAAWTVGAEVALAGGGLPLIVLPRQQRVGPSLAGLR